MRAPSQSQSCTVSELRMLPIPHWTQAAAEVGVLALLQHPIPQNTQADAEGTPGEPTDRMTGQNSSQLWQKVGPALGVTLQAQEAYPFHDGWNIACFIIVMVFILTVVSLATLAVLYELLDCGCCAKDKTFGEPREEAGLCQDETENTDKHDPEEV
ncbi:hypothetical protein AGOR_G00231960 [Albula goreensis]|uniref:Small integral membrane protein 18 n=1 Tax=Albula goreensis TaxID=1534307 RepID=A0A8T3CLN5_9TELE|nr:hypothetical protein AGOR_G00231960 [Albula goreensis]